MASWVLMCKNCAQTIKLSEIIESDLESFYFPRKPELPPSGEELECPHCHQKANYERANLLYRA
jgi:hypothetical protein